MNGEIKRKIRDYLENEIKNQITEFYKNIVDKDKSEKWCEQIFDNTIENLVQLSYYLNDVEYESFLERIKEYSRKEYEKLSKEEKEIFNERRKYLVIEYAYKTNYLHELIPIRRSKQIKNVSEIVTTILVPEENYR